jgi:hypothetical protein
MATQVELDIFSGRPNPRWVIDGPKEVELIERLAAVNPDTTVEDAPAGLGYRGFVITLPASTPYDLSGTLHVFGEQFCLKTHDTKIVREL